MASPPPTCAPSACLRYGTGFCYFEKCLHNTRLADLSLNVKMACFRCAPLSHPYILFTKVKVVGEEGCPGGAVVESLPANAGDAGSGPGLGGSRMLRSGWARESQLLSLRVWSLCSATGGAGMVGGPRTAMRGGPRLPQLEEALAQKRRPNTAINKIN